MTIKSRLAVIVSWFIMCFAVAIILNFAFYYIMPFEYWVEYDSVRPAKESFKVGERLAFITEKATHKVCNLSFNDILYCQNGESDSYKFYIDQNSRHFNCQPNKDQTILWEFRHAVSEPTECYLESNVTLHLPWGIKKNSTYRGDVFRIEK